MRVLSLIEHLTRGDRSGDRPNHLDTNVLVAALKGGTFNGYSKITIGGSKRRLDATQPDLVLDWAAERLGSHVARAFRGRKIALVPIPGHACTSADKVAVHRVHSLAARIASWIDEHRADVDVRTMPLLFWARVMNSAHKERGTRDPSEIVKHYRSPTAPRLDKRSVVLVDDVVTTGAKLCAAQQHLVGRGVNVEEPAFAVARTVHKKGVAAKVATQIYDPWPGGPDDELPF